MILLTNEGSRKTRNLREWEDGLEMKSNVTPPQ
jgi:hypothetical protein